MYPSDVALLLDTTDQFPQRHCWTPSVCTWGNSIRGALAWPVRTNDYCFMHCFWQLSFSIASLVVRSFISLLLRNVYANLIAILILFCPDLHLSTEVMPYSTLYGIACLFTAHSVACHSRALRRKLHVYFKCRTKYL